MCDQVISTDGLPRLQHNKSRHKLAPLRIRYSDHCRFADRGMAVDDSLDLAGVDIFSAGYDHVFQAILNIEVIVFILIADISSAKHSISKAASSFYRVIPITARDVRPAGH